MIADQASADAPAGAVVDRCVAHTENYHLRCSACDAETVVSVFRNSLRAVCPACRRRLTLPATFTTTCSACGHENTFNHHLAGHSAACRACGGILALPPLVGRAASRRRVRRRRSTRHHGARTLAFADGAEQSLFILAAAIGTLIFLLITSV